MPASLPDAAQVSADIAACRALMRTGSRSFFAASHLLPRRIRKPAMALYAFCRLADDAIDCRTGDEAGILAELRERLDLACRGIPADHPADRALAATIAQFDMPPDLPFALLEGLEWDFAGRRYETLDDLLDYAARVAGSVGAMMAVLMGARNPVALARACDLGVAMQLTNIARDVGEDARAGRLYLPLAWLAEAGIDADAFLAAPQTSPELSQVVQRLLRSADAFYASGAGGIAALPIDCRPGIRAAGLIYAEIGRVIAGNTFDSVSVRARVPGRRKLAILSRSLLSLPGVAAEAAPALPACQYLVDAAAAEARVKPRFAPLQALDARVNWVFELFARLQLEQMEQR